MLNTTFGNKDLIFPSLRFITKVNFSSWANDGKDTTPLYKLDWDEFDSQLIRNLGNDFPYQALPDEYEKRVRKLTFAVSSKYRQGISHYSHLAQVERNRYSPYDTMVREVCLGVATEAVRVAFFLLKDCTYDQETEGFDRSNDRILFTNMLVWRFWVHQTGRGVVWQHANLDRLANSLVYLDASSMEEDAERALLIRIFLQNMEEHVDSWEVHHPPLGDAVKALALREDEKVH